MHGIAIMYLQRQLKLLLFNQIAAMFSENVPYSLDNVKIIYDIHIDFTQTLESKYAGLRVLTVQWGQLF